jgi:cyclophilin family peptidyl-prolyl cis-trans isomerase
MRRLIAVIAGLFLAGGVAAQPAPAPAPVAPPTVEAANIWVLDLSTGGRVRILLRPDVAPNHVERVKLLTKEGFYNGTVFHRVIDGFMAQGGDPTATGGGGSKYPDLKAEFNDLPHVRGALAAARPEDKDGANSQFYICFLPALKLDRLYTVFGRVIDGMEYVDAIERGEPPATPSKILRASMASDNLPPLLMVAPAALLDPVK